MIDRRIAAVALVVVATLGGVTAATAPAIAQADDEGSGLADVFTSGDPVDRVGNWLTAISASRERAGFWVQERLPESLTERLPSLAPDRQTAEEEISGVADYYNAHNETLEAYVNERGTFSTNRTVKVILHLRGETAKRYLEADVADGNVTRSEIVASTDREITDTLEVCGYAADQSHEELRHFNEEFARPNKDVTDEYLATLAGKYGGDVETTIVSYADGDCGGGS